MKKLLLLALLLMACDNSTSSDTVEIDWILLKNTQMIGDNYEEIITEEDPGGTGEFHTVLYTGIGYTFLYNSSVSDISLPEGNIDYTLENFDGLFSFTYQSEQYSFDLTDSYNEELGKYLIKETGYGNISKIICDNNMSYCNSYFQDGFGYLLSLSSPFELIGYK